MLNNGIQRLIPELSVGLFRAGNRLNVNSEETTSTVIQIVIDTQNCRETGYNVSEDQARPINMRHHIESVIPQGENILPNCI